MAYQSHDLNPLPLVEVLPREFVKEYQGSVSPKIIVHNGTVLLAEDNLIENSHDAEEIDEKVANIDKIIPVDSSEDDEIEEMMNDNANYQGSSIADQKLEKVDEFCSVTSPVQEYIREKGNGIEGEEETISVDNNYQESSNDNQRPEVDELSTVTQPVLKSYSPQSNSPQKEMEEVTRDDDNNRESSNGDQRPKVIEVSSTILSDQKHNVIKMKGAMQNDAKNRERSNGDQKPQFIKLSSTTSSQEHVIKMEEMTRNYGTRRASCSVDQKPVYVRKVVMMPAQEESFHEDNGMPNERNEQRTNSAKEAMHRKKKEDKLFARLMVSFTVFIIIMSIFGIVMPQNAGVIVFCTLIPIFYTLLALVHWFLNQKEVSPNLAKTEALRKNMQFLPDEAIL